MTTVWDVDGEHVIVVGHWHLLVESNSNPNQFHTVEIDDEGNAQCTCQGWSFAKPGAKTCRHARMGERLVREQAIVRVLSEA